MLFLSTFLFQEFRLSHPQRILFIFLFTIAFFIAPYFSCSLTYFTVTSKGGHTIKVEPALN